jgi:hypothetical protein
MSNHLGEPLAKISEERLGDLISPNQGQRGRLPAHKNLQPLSLKERAEVRFHQDGGVELPVGLRTGGGPSTRCPLHCVPVLKLTSYVGRSVFIDSILQF